MKEPLAYEPCAYDNDISTMDHAGLAVVVKDMERRVGLLEGQHKRAVEALDGAAGPPTNVGL